MSEKAKPLNLSSELRRSAVENAAVRRTPSDGVGSPQLQRRISTLQVSESKDSSLPTHMRRSRSGSRSGSSRSRHGSVHHSPARSRSGSQSGGHGGNRSRKDSLAGAPAHHKSPKPNAIGLKAADKLGVLPASNQQLGNPKVRQMLGLNSVDEPAVDNPKARQLLGLHDKHDNHKSKK